MLKIWYCEKIIFEVGLVLKIKMVIDNINFMLVDCVCYIVSVQVVGFEIVGYFFEIEFKGVLECNYLCEGKVCIFEIGIRVIV